MPIDARIPLGTTGGGFRAPDPGRLIAQAESIRGIQSRRRATDALANERQQALARQEARRKAFVFDPETNQVDEEATRANLAEIGDFEAISAIDAAKAKAESARLKDDETRLDIRKKKADAFSAEQEAAADEMKARARWLSTIKDNASLRTAFAGMAAEGLIPQDEADNAPEFSDELKTEIDQFVKGSRDLEDRRKEAASAAKEKATGKNRKLVNAERERHNRELERIANRRGDQADARQREQPRHNLRMEKLTGEKQTGDDPVARRQREQETRKQVNELDREEQRLDRAQTAIGQQLATPDGEDFVSIGKTGTAIEQEMTPEIRKALENRQKANEQEVLAVARRKARKVFGDKIKKATKETLRIYANRFGISLAQAEREMLSDGFIIEE